MEPCEQVLLVSTSNRDQLPGWTVNSRYSDNYGHDNYGSGVWLRIAKQYLSCALVRGRGIVFRHHYQSIAKCAGKDFRDGAAVPFE